MATFCLIPEAVQKFKQGLKNREIDPLKLSLMESSVRRDFLEKYVGKDAAPQVNSLFESKLLLKNQKAGYLAWAKKIAGLTPEVRRDLVAKIEKLDKVLNPTEEKAFLNDLANTRLGVDVTFAEAQKISELSKKIADLKEFKDKKGQIEYGNAILDLSDYVNSLSGKKADLITNIAGVPRAAMTSFDLSAPLNQGWGMVSRKNFYKSFASMFKYVVSKKAFRDLQAETITNPFYPQAKKAGLRLTDLGGKLELREEAFMTTLLDRIPGVSASQRAYTGFLNKLRMDSFTDLVKKAEVAGEDVSLGSKALEDLAKVVNNFTGGARVGKLEQATPILNATFFSPRKIASTLQMMNPVNYVDPKISKTARLEATRNMIGSLAMSAGVIALYSLLTGKKQEADPTSSDFGKIRSEDTRLDVSGGNANYVGLLARLVTQKIKGGSGISRELGTKYGETSGFDLLAQFLRYKLSPNASFLVDAVARSNAIGEKKTITESAIDRFKPMFANSVVELLQSDTDDKFGLALASLFGAGVNTYSSAGTSDWNESEGKQLLQFKKKVGQEKFDEANDLYTEKYDEWSKWVQKESTYQKLSDEEKQAVIKRKKTTLQEHIFKRYNFEYKQQKKSKAQLDRIKKLAN